MELFRESAVGQLVRYATRNKMLMYPEEMPDFSWAPLVSDLMHESLET
jgi:MFS transporter, DHA1 family, multidrug resistance protein